VDDTHASVVNYWNHRSQLGDMAGTRDLAAKRLEMETLATHLRPAGKVLDAGCGNGLSMAWLKNQMPDIDLYGIDNSDGMVGACKAHLQSEGCEATVELASVLDYDPGFKFSTIYTERTLINLPDWDTQKRAILHILSLLEPSELGVYLMMENSQEGVDIMNAWRHKLGLDPVKPPWHNRYLRDAELETIFDNDLATLWGIIDYSAGYYLMSRVVNAWLAKQENLEPQYDSPLNTLGIMLPELESRTFVGQGRLWVWQTK